MHQEICPLTGKPCDKPKCIHITEVGDNNMIQELHLCQECGIQMIPLNIQGQPKEKPKDASNVKKIKVNSGEKPHEKPVDNLLNMLDVFMGSTAPVDKEVVIPKKILNESKCPGCGITLNEIAKTSKLGCGQCYEHFEKELMPALIHAQKSLKHKGKVPKQWLKKKQEEKKKIPEDLPTLELLLKRAIEHEKYEEAAKIRDKIKKLKSSE